MISPVGTDVAHVGKDGK